MKEEISLCLVCEVGQRGQQIKRRPTQFKWVLILTNRCAPLTQFDQIFKTICSPILSYKMSTYDQKLIIFTFFLYRF